MKNTTDTKKKRSQRDYSMAFKLLVIGQVEKGDFTYKQAQIHYGIQGRSTVLTWLRKHGNLDWINPQLSAMTKNKETPSQKIKRLEKEVADLKLVNSIKDDLIYVIDTRYGGDFRKKYLAKLSEKNKNKEQ